MIVSKNLAEIKALAAQMPVGYLEYLLSIGKVEDDTVVLDEAAQDNVREKYPFPGQAGVFSRAMIEASASCQPTGFVEFLLSRGKIKDDLVTLDCKTQDEFNQKFPPNTRAQIYPLATIAAYFERKPKGMLEFVRSKGRVVDNFLILTPQAHQLVRQTFSRAVSVSYNISSLRASAHERPEGYVDQALALGRVEGDFVILEPPKWKQLMKMFPPTPKALKYTRAELLAEAKNRPEGYVDYVLSAGKLEGTTVTLDVTAQNDVNHKFPAAVKFNVAHLKEDAARRPKGYVDFVLAHGKIEGAFVVLDGVAQKKIREKFPHPYLSPPPEPTVQDMAANFAGAMAGWAKAGFKTVERAVYEKRLATCNACEHWDAFARAGLGKCNICGCSKFKFWLVNTKCPDKPPRW